MIYHSDDGFSLSHEKSGWRWQERGAAGWSELYRLRRMAVNAIAKDFGVLDFETGEVLSCSPVFSRIPA